MNEKMTFTEFKIEVRRRMKNRNDDLESLFSEQNYDEMPGKFTPNTILVTHEGHYITGENSKDYWSKVGDMNGKKLKFIGKYFDAKELILRPGHTKEDFNYVAVEVTEFSFDVNGKNYGGYIDPPHRHRVKCTIDD